MIKSLAEVLLHPVTQTERTNKARENKEDFAMKKCLALLMAFVLFTTAQSSVLADTIQLPGGLETIEEEAFSQTTSIDTVKVPYGTKTIGSKAFAYSSLASISIPDSVDFIAEDAFEGTNVVFHVSSDSYARSYADAHEIPWVEDKDDSVQGAISSVLNLEAGLLTWENTLQEPVEILSAEGITDAEYLAFIREYNGYAAELNQMIEAFNASQNAFYGAMDALSGAISVMSVAEIGGNTVCSLYGYQMEIDGSLLSQAGESFEVLSIERPENAEYLILETSVGDYYLRQSGDAITLTSQAPSQPRSISRGGGAGEAMLNKFIEVFTDIQNKASGFESAMSLRMETLTAEIKKTQDMLEFEKSVVSGSTQGSVINNVGNRLSTDHAKKLAKLQKQLNGWEKVSQAFTVLNIFATVNSMKTLAEHWRKALDISYCGHPLERDKKFPSTQQIAENLPKDINAIIWLYSADLLANAVSLVTGIGSLLSVATFNPTGLVNFILNLAAYALTSAMSAKEDRLYNQITAAETTLHTYVYGMVLDQKTKKVLQGAFVLDGESIAETDDWGRYVLFLEPGATSLLFRMTNYQDNAITVMLNPGEPQKLDVTMLTDSAKLYGTVRDSVTEYGIPGVTVRCGNSMTMTDASGYYNFSVPLGSQTLTFSHADYQEPDGIPLTLSPNQMQRINMAMAPLHETGGDTPQDPSWGDPSGPIMEGYIPIDETHFPDSILMSYVSRFDIYDYDEEENFNYHGQDGLLSPEERAAVQSIVLQGDVTSLIGIQYFGQLTNLSCSVSGEQDVSGLPYLETLSIGGSISALNAAGCASLKHFNCPANMKTLNLSGCTSLKWVNCPDGLENLNLSGCSTLDTIYINADNSQLKTLDVSGCTAMTTIYNRNPRMHFSQLTALNASGCTALTGLIYENGLLKTLDVSGCTAMTTLLCDRNQLTSLNVSGCTALETLDCRQNQLTALNVSGFAALRSFHCESNQLASLNVSGCTALTHLDCGENHLTELNLSGLTALTHLGCYRNLLTELPSGLRGLKSLACGFNLLTSLDVSGFASLESLLCQNNKLTALNVSGCTALRALYCQENELTALNLSDCTGLQELDCSDNQLTALHVSGFAAMKYLTCDNNQLSELTVSGCAAMERIKCNDNMLETLDLSGLMALTRVECMRNILTSLDVSQRSHLEQLYCYNNQLEELSVSGCTALTTLDCYTNLLESLDISDLSKLKTVQCTDNRMAVLNASGCSALTSLSFPKGYLMDVDLSGCSSLTGFTCTFGSLRRLNVSGCTAMTSVTCYNNQLMNLNVSGCTALRSLRCQSNQLAALNASGCSALDSLYCQQNQLTSLIVAGCSALATLFCKNNQLTTLDVSDCPSALYLSCDEGVEVIR